MERFLKYSNLLTNTDITFKGQDRNIFLSNYAEAEQLNYSQNIEITKQIMRSTYLDDVT